MGWGRRLLLSSLLQILVLHSSVHGSRGLPLSPIKAPAVPVSVPPKEVTSNLLHVNQLHFKGSPVISPAPDEVQNSLNPGHPPLKSYFRSYPAVSPVAHEAKNASNATNSQTSHPGSPPVVSPAPKEVNNPSNATPTSWTSQPSPSPVKTPTPNEAKNPLNTTPAPWTSHPVPEVTPSPQVQSHSNNVLPPVMSDLGSPPSTSPLRHEHENPLNNAPAPISSNASPVVSPLPYYKSMSNISHSPLISHLPTVISHPICSPVVSPAPHEAKNPSNTIPGPSTSDSSVPPVVSPAPHETRNPPIPSSAPSTSFTLMSPVPQQIENSSHIPPISSTPYPSSSPMISPVPHGSKNPSNSTLGPSTSNSSVPPVISPAPHEIKNPQTSRSSVPPTLSPAPQEIKNSPTSNSSVPPVISPAPHEHNNPETSNSSRPPVISPAPHEIKNPPTSNSSVSPVPTSNSSVHPLISPAPHEIKNPPSPMVAPSTGPPRHQIETPSNTPRSLTSHPRSSPTVSPEPNGVKNHSSTVHVPSKSEPSFPPVSSPEPHRANDSPGIRHAPTASHPKPPAASTHRIPSSTAPTTPIHHRTASRSVRNHSAAPKYVLPPSSHNSGPVVFQAPLHPPRFPKNMHRHGAPPLYVQAPSLPPIQAPYSSNIAGIPSPSPSLVIPSTRNGWPGHSPTLPPRSSRRKPIVPLPGDIWAPPPKSGPIHSPTNSPSGSNPKKPRAPTPRPVWRLPSPPPNYDCNSLQCSEPLANSPPGSPCSCVLPVKVELRLGVALYTFFPLVSELAQEIAAGIFLKQSQVRIMGANAANVDPEKTIVLIDLVPLGKYFDNTTAFFIYERFWHKQVVIEASFFGDYDVLNVLYPGLPQSPPSAPSDINVGNGIYGNNNNARTIHPLGVDVRKPRKEKVSDSLIAIIVLSSLIAFVFVIGAAWLLVLKHRDHAHLSSPTRHTSLPTFAKPSGSGPTIIGSGPNSASASISSSIPTYTGSAKTFTLAEIERATKRFDDTRIIGEGGFGRVYEGTLEDGTRVAVKALKRDDQQGGREFLAEVEMLGRLHHRNLVKLIGICIEDTRCLVYELIPNGSVESHLHGVDKHTAPLDWGSRVKIALGAARALAYLHEDSSPRVIHRDFKSSNILLEHDFTPKVSDFGLARTAMDGGNEHVSTRVMGTFGYVAPEYAMTGHLLVKSDVYSYGVVLLELLTGRKPVDMLQPPGQENLVTWARPLLTSTEGLDLIIDPVLGTDVQYDSITKVAAIASMCVQPEVSHRPFMGEVVQALKLVCNENDEHRPSGSYSREELFVQDKGIKSRTGLDLEAERMLSPFDIYSTSAGFSSDSFRRCSSSGPFEAGRSRQAFQGVRGLSKGSMSEHGVAFRYATVSEGHGQWPEASL